MRNKEVTQEQQIDAWIKRGEALIYPQRKENWNICVNERVQDLYKGLDVDNALDVMEALNQGKTIDEALEMIDDQNHSGGSYFMVTNILLVFAKQGVELYRAQATELSEKAENYLQKIAKENAQFERELQQHNEKENGLTR